MTRRRTILQVAGGLAVLLALSLRAGADVRTAVAHVDRALQLAFAAGATDEQVKAGFLSLLDAIVASAPEARIPGEWPSKAAAARRLVAAGSVPDDRAVAMLHECYRNLHGGRAFRMPAAIRSISDATGYARRQLEAARDLLLRGQREEAIRRLLDTALMIVTPFEQ